MVCLAAVAPADREVVSKMKQTQTGTQPLISLQNIYKIYQMGDMVVRANDGISLDIYPGEFVSIVGKSGSGKSTIMNIIGALDVPTEGKYLERRGCKRDEGRQPRGNPQQDHRVCIPTV